MSTYDTYKMMNVPKFMSKQDLIKMRDEIAANRTWGAILTGLIIGGTGFVGQIAAYLAFTVGAAVGISCSFSKGANDRIQDILDNYNCDNGIYVVLKAEGHFNIAGNELKEIKYLDVLGLLGNGNPQATWV